ncbi:Aminomethyltransferase folate-binding domain-containing protein [Trametopsis cervina]|nr:Aminomethyltransferase folate-binding domain-containing protein [Trametopsis cervina]
MTIPSALRALVRTTPTLAPIPRRALLSVRGSQASEFLSGLVASGVPPPEGHYYTAFLHAQGRVMYDAFVHAHTTSDGKPGYLLEFDAHASEAQPLLAMLKRYVLRSKVKLSDVSDEFDVWGVWGSEAEKRWEGERRWAGARSGVVEPVWNVEGEEQKEWHWGVRGSALRDRRAVGMGERVVVRKGDKPAQTATHDTAGATDYVLHRILHGVPEGVNDIVPMRSFPMDSNMDIMGALDFRKGCYVGQELTVRTYHTGLIRKRIFPVHILPATPSSSSALPTSLPTDIDIRLVQNAPTEGSAKVRPRGTGKLLSNIGGAGLALLRLEQVAAVEQGTAQLEMYVESGDGSVNSWVVRPWRPEWWPDLSMKEE